MSIQYLYCNVQYFMVNIESVKDVKNVRVKPEHLSVTIQQICYDIEYNMTDALRQTYS